MVIGIPGGVGSGKSRMVSYLRDTYGASVIEADKVAAELEQPGGAALQPLIDAFGTGIVNEEGELDREAFSARIFSDPEALEQVNAIVHPLTIEEIKKCAEDPASALTVVEAAVFPEGLRNLCDEIWFVDADEKIRKERLMSDRGYSLQKCEDIMGSQAPREEFLSLCDHVIDNNGSMEDIRPQIEALLGPADDRTERDVL